MLNVTLIQSDLAWENRTANLAHFLQCVQSIPGNTDLIVLPEMFNTGFTMNTAVAEPMNPTTTKWMKQMAAQTSSLLIGSFTVKQGDKFYNRLLCVKPDGTHASYDKRHLFTMGQEHLTYTAGESRLVFMWKGWKICPLICYDLRFPVWSRNAASDPYDLLMYVANWPSRRAHAWKTLLMARAIENQSYLVGVNRVGVDGNGLSYQGDSVALDYLGEPATMLGSIETEKIVRFSKAELDQYRQSFPALSDSDSFEIS